MPTPGNAKALRRSMGRGDCTVTPNNDGLEGKMTYEQKALEILRAMAKAAAEGKSLTIAEDWGFGSATVFDQAGAHTHIGYDGYDDEQHNLEAFVDGLHSLLVDKRGLSWAKPSK